MVDILQIRGGIKQAASDLPTASRNGACGLPLCCAHTYAQPMDGSPADVRDDGRTCWVGDIPLALAQPSAQAANTAEQEAVSLSRDEGTIAGFAGQRVVSLLEEHFGPVERAVVRVKTASTAVSKGDRRLRDRRSWALVTFKADADADAACLDGMLVPATLPARPGAARVPLRIRPSNVSGELAKGHRGALAQVAERDAEERAIVARNVTKRPTLRDAARSIMQMQRAALQFRDGFAAPAHVAAGAPTKRGHSVDVRWIAEDPCGLAMGPQAWTDRSTSRHRTTRPRPEIKQVKRTVVR
jgi:hypothetical protein